MGLSEKEKELIFRKSKESIQEVTGWRALIFLPQNISWRFCIIITVFITCEGLITTAFYSMWSNEFAFFKFILNMVYIADFILSLCHYVMKQTRKLKYGYRRHFIFLIVDFISVLPLDTIFSGAVAEARKDQKISNFLGLVAIIRLYQIPVSFSIIKNSLNNIKIYSVVYLVELVMYCVIITHFLSCFIFLYFDETERSLCKDQQFLCVLENFMVTFFLLFQYFVPPFTGYPLEDYKALLVVCLFIGYFLMYGFLTPVFIFRGIGQIYKDFENYKNLLDVKILTKNKLGDVKLEEDIFKYYRYLLTFGKGEKQREMLNIFPIAFQKSICCDLYWEAMRHSTLLRNLSIGCKRSLAIHMTAEFVLPKTVLFRKEKDPNYFLYLESGLLQVMSTENVKTSVLNLTRGTVLGEISFFLHLKSEATVRAANFSVIHVLKFRDFFKVLSDYPQDRKKMFKIVKRRLEFAKSMHKFKREIFSVEQLFDVTISTEKGNIKWLKKQYRVILDMKNARELMNLNPGNQYLADDYQRQVHNLETKMEHTSLLLHQTCISNEGTDKEEVVCVRMKFPWLMDPECHFFTVWRKIIFMVSFAVTCTYPGFIGWIGHIPRWFFNISIAVSIIYMLDVVLRFFTAVKDRNVLKKTYFSIIVHNITDIYLYVDTLAAIPFQIIFYGCTERFCSNMFYVNPLVKGYVVAKEMSEWNYQSKRGMFIRTFIIKFFTLSMLLYWTAVVFSLSGIECIFYDCSENDWFVNMVKTAEETEKVSVCLIKAISIGLRIPEEVDMSNVEKSYLVLISVFVVIHFYCLFLKGACAASFILDISSSVENRNLMSFVFDFMRKHGMVGKLRTRVLSTLKFYWYHQDGINFVKEEQILNLLPVNLKNRLDRTLKLPLLAKSKLFQWEDEEFLHDLCKNTVWLTVPPNSLLLTLAKQMRYLYVVKKGFVQINSFIPGDLYLRLSKPISARIGDIFPVVDALSQIPCGVNAVTVSDCELLLLDLENVLSVMTIHDVFKDFIEAVRETDLSALTSAKLAVSRYERGQDKGNKREVVSVIRVKFLNRVLRCLIWKRGISSVGIRYLYWELARVSYLMICLIVWPIVLGPGVTWKCYPTCIKTLFALDMVFICDFCIRMLISYYNEIGIYVTCTFHTALHYLTTSFVTDLLAFVPNFHIMYAIHENNFDFHWFTFIVHVGLRSLSCYRFIGIVSYLTTGKKISFLKQFIIAIFLLILIVHCYICFMVLLYVKGIRKPSYRLVKSIPHITKPDRYYINEFGLVVTLLLKVGFYLTHYVPLSAVVSTMLGTTGFIIEILLYSYIIVNSMIKGKNLISQHYYERTLVNFLMRYKMEDTRMLDYFRYKWSQQHGISLKKVFSGLPQSLQEDVMLPLYKQTLSGVASLSNANESFYRILARNVEEEVFKEECPVIFQEEVQSYIYFVHKGQCFVENLGQLLNKGAMFGDIKWQGLMRSNIFTRKEVTLLKIPSKVFFQTLNDFYATKRAFQAEVAEVDDFIQSTYIADEEVFSENFTFENEFEESEFVPMADAEQSGYNVSRKNVKKFILNRPGPKMTQYLRFVFLLIAYCTLITIPNFIGMRLASPGVLSVIYLLDFLWVIKIVVSWWMSKGLNKNVRKRYRIFMVFCKVVYNLLTVLPIEVIPLANCGFKMSGECCYIMTYCYVNRMLRIFYVFDYFRTTKRRATISSLLLTLVEIILFKCAILSISTTFVILDDDYLFAARKCNIHLSEAQKEDILSAYLCGVNAMVGTSLSSCMPNTYDAVCLKLAIAFFSFLAKITLVNNVFLMLFERNYNNVIQKVKLQHLDNYLLVRGVSPYLREKCKKYSNTLLNSFYEGAEPTFLKISPTYLKLELLETLYMPYLSGCSLFQQLDKNFLRQLALRLYQNIFFPGDHITEKGDVDHNMYFIQRGEVYCIENDSYYTALETAADLYFSGHVFGVMQGLLAAHPHTHTYRAKTLTFILVLNYDHWEDLRLAFPAITDSIFKRCMEGLKPT